MRLAGVETGEYHFAQQIKQDQYDRVKGLTGIEVYFWNAWLAR